MASWADLSDGRVDAERELRYEEKDYDEISAHDAAAKAWAAEQHRLGNEVGDGVR